MATFTETENKALGELSIQEFVLSASSHLNFQEMIVVNDLLADITITDIAKKHDCSRVYMTRIVKNIRDKLSKIISYHLDI